MASAFPQPAAKPRIGLVGEKLRACQKALSAFFPEAELVATGDLTNACDIKLAFAGDGSPAAPQLEISCKAHGRPAYSRTPVAEIQLSARGEALPRHLAHLEGSRYLNPATGGLCEKEVQGQVLTASDRLDAMLEGPVHAVGLRREKRAVLEDTVFRNHNEMHFFETAEEAITARTQAGGKLLLWASRVPAKIKARINSEKIPTLYMEDGFIRSRGLGLNLVPPLSLVLDTGGAYFDMDAQSDLERILNETDFSAEDLSRAGALIERLKETGISKYNADGTKSLPTTSEGKTILLVPGQVEDDASIQFGSPDFKSNLTFLREVRRRNPHAFLIYKPHPDTLAKKARPGGGALTQFEKVCDHLLMDCGPIEAIALCDEVHSMTSTLGFEALIRGKRVYTYGLPFYAGWGLTKDSLASKRRQRERRLEELVAGVLISYPFYQTPEGLPCRVEDVIDILASGYSYPLAWVRPVLRPLMRRLGVGRRALAPDTRSLAALAQT